MESILKAIKKKKIPINPAIVISNKQDAKGLKIAQKLGVKIEVVQSKGFKGTRAEYDKEIISILTKHGVTPKNGLVCLAGFMRIISPEFVKKYKNKIINIHPALLPAFPGLDSQKQALEYGAKVSGCSVHFVDSEESLSKRILKEEHRIYPEAVNLFARKKIKVSGRRTVIS
jgi:phosphoribosylglycinamide formyltransferase-1